MPPPPSPPLGAQEYQFLVEDPGQQTLEVHVHDATITGRAHVGSASIPLSCLPQQVRVGVRVGACACVCVHLSLQALNQGMPPRW